MPTSQHVSESGRYVTSQMLFDARMAHDLFRLMLNGAYDSQDYLSGAANMKALVTGSGGLIGYEFCRLLCQHEWEVIGLDNDMRAAYFGIDGSTRRQIINLKAQFRNYKHAELDIRGRASI